MKENRPENVRWLRERYLGALRSGIVDSTEDLEVVLFAKEVNGIILSADQGIVNMAEALAIETLSAEDFANRFAPEQ